MIVNEFFLNGAVEAFDVGVHLRGLGVGVVVDDLQFKEPLSKVFLELGAVVREYECHRIWKHLTPLLKEVFRGLGSVRSGAPGKGESGMDVFAGDDVGSETMREAFEIEKESLMSLGFLRAFKRFVLSIFPLPLVRSGAVRSPPLSLMMRPIVAGLGHTRCLESQKSLSRGYSFFSPRLGWTSRSRRRRSSSTMRQSYRRCRFFLGEREPQLRLSSRPFPSWSFFCQPNNVRRFTPYASSTASRPYFFQKLITLARFLATSLIIYANRIAYSCSVREPFTPLLTLNILMLLCYKGVQYVSEVMHIWQQNTSVQIV